MGPRAQVQLTRVGLALAQEAVVSPCPVGAGESGGSGSGSGGGGGSLIAPAVVIPVLLVALAALVLVLRRRRQAAQRSHVLEKPAFIGMIENPAFSRSPDGAERPVMESSSNGRRPSSPGDMPAETLQDMGYEVPQSIMVADKARKASTRVDTLKGNSNNNNNNISNIGSRRSHVPAPEEPGEDNDMYLEHLPHLPGQVPSHTSQPKP